MTSEELEQSLKTEFENYLNSKLDALKQDVSDFHTKFETEFAKHKSQMDEAIQALANRFGSAPQLDRGFSESIVEHLRLARDEGAELTAAAFGEAEKLKQATEPAAARYDKLRDAVADISSQMSQATILSSLVEHAADFAPRGVFFIVKNEQFVGWKSFGTGPGVAENAVQEIRFPLSANTLLSTSVSTLGTAEGVYDPNSDDDQYLAPLEFGRPDRMYAIPLTARGRGVAVLYVDYGIDGVVLNVEALEMLVSVAGLTVELRATAAASMHAAQSQPAQEVEHDDSPTASQENVDTSYDETASEPETEPAYASYQEPAAADPVSYESQTSYEEPVQQYQSYAEEPVAAEPAYAEPVVEQTSNDYSEPEYASYGDASPTEEYSAPIAAEPVEEVEQPSASDEYVGAVVYENESESPAQEYTDPVQAFEAQPVEFADPQIVEEPEIERGYEQEPVAAEPVQVESFHQPDEYQPPAGYSFETPEEPKVETFQAPAPEPEPMPSSAAAGNGHAAEPATVASVGDGQSQFKSRFSDRTIDLPIDVPEEERKLHNNARRFARLLVSEIKLYNEQKVVEGREAGDLYDRLREAIDRSREMYDKRVEPNVAAKFDYFHYELLNSLAEGESTKLGASYPGAVV